MKNLKQKIIEILEEINDFIVSVKVKQKKLNKLGKPLKEYIAEKIVEAVEEDYEKRDYDTRTD